MVGPRPGALNLYDNVRVGGQNLYGPRPHIEYHMVGGDIRSVDVCWEPVSVLPNELNFRNDYVWVGGQNLYDPRPHIKYHMAGNDVRSVDVCGEPVPLLPNELNFQGEIDVQNLYGQWSPRSKNNSDHGGVELKRGNLYLRLE